MVSKQLKLTHTDENALRRDAEELRELAYQYPWPIWDPNERDLEDDELLNLYLRREAKRAEVLVRRDLTEWPDRDNCPHFGKSNWADHRLHWFVWPEELGPPYRETGDRRNIYPACGGICASCERTVEDLLHAQFEALNVEDGGILLVRGGDPFWLEGFPERLQEMGKRILLVSLAEGMSLESLRREDAQEVYERLKEILGE